MDDGKPIKAIKRTLFHQKTIFDGWRSITVALYMALLGYAVLVGIPVISSAWVELLGFSEAEVNRVAGADLGGLSLGSVIASLLINRINRRYIVFMGIVLAVAANGLCMIYLQYDYVIWLRAAAGIGSGIYTSIAIATLGGTSRPALAFNMMLFAFAFTQAAEMAILPQLTMNEIYGLFISLYLFSLFFIHWVPAHAAHGEEIEIDVEDTQHQHQHLHKHLSKFIPWFCLGAIFFTYINIGTYWTNIEIATVGAGVDEELISSSLIWASFMSLLGCLVATLISDRFGLSKPLLIALLAIGLSAAIMSGGITESIFLISVFGFNFLWIFIDVYQMGSMANFDPTGKYVALIPGAQGLGQIVGPNIAALFLTYNLGYSSVFLMCGIASIIGLLIYALIYMRLRKTIPALADAS